TLRYDEAAFPPPLRALILSKGDVVIGVRPYAVHRSQEGAQAQVIANQWLGDQSHIAASFAGASIVLVEHDRAALAEGDAICIKIAPADLHVFDAKTGQALSHGQELA
ncbi:TOBE domain-containing protein, partial [Cypionkella sp.]|uniref:TOBE domain-containing protein n=1 Tax=Cypionkella sp. TaxID=2811411 RepID=UPI002FDDB1D7